MYFAKQGHTLASYKMIMEYVLTSDVCHAEVASQMGRDPKRGVPSSKSTPRNLVETSRLFLRPKASRQLESFDVRTGRSTSHSESQRRLNPSHDITPLLANSYHIIFILIFSFLALFDSCRSFCVVNLLWIIDYMWCNKTSWTAAAAKLPLRSVPVAVCSAVCGRVRVGPSADRDSQYNLNRPDPWNRPKGGVGFVIFIISSANWVNDGFFYSN